MARAQRPQANQRRLSNSSANRDVPPTSRHNAQYNGVSYDGKNCRWIARLFRSDLIKRAGGGAHIGFFPTAIEAAKAVDGIVWKYGDWEHLDYLNFPTPSEESGVKRKLSMEKPKSSVERESSMEKPKSSVKRKSSMEKPKSSVKRKSSMGGEWGSWFENYMKNISVKRESPLGEPKSSVERESPMWDPKSSVEMTPYKKRKLNPEGKMGPIYSFWGDIAKKADGKTTPSNQQEPQNELQKQ